MFSLKAIRRAQTVFIHDLVMAAVSLALSLYLRVGGNLFQELSPREVLLSDAMFTAIAATIFSLHGMYRGVWRYASLRDLFAIGRAVTLTSLLFLLGMFLVTRLDNFPRSVVVINWFVLIFLLGLPRLTYRTLKDGLIGLRDHGERIPVLLVGVDKGTDFFIREMGRRDGRYAPVGVLSTTAGRIGRDVNGIRVLGSLSELAAVVTGLDRRGLRPKRLILSQEKLSPDQIQSLLDECNQLGLSLDRLPELTEFKPGIDPIEIRPIAIEDLLGRPQAALDRNGMRRLVEGRRVLVTGAGGSIGSELVRQVAGFAPAELTLVESSEFALYTIDMEMAESHPLLLRRALIADVRDDRRIRQIFAEVTPELVFHAAALKHVPLVEHNPVEGILTNAIGTRVVADACRETGVRLMVMISTDKAVNPTNVMGTSKRIAEIYCQALDLADSGSDATQYITVRFGNVLGSTGSVVPLFRRQLERGGPLTVTHPDMTRYFMTIREAVELVLHASAYGSSMQDYRGRIFVLDMGRPVKIVDLARQMIHLAGLRPDKDIKITFTGLRPGEKLFEEVFHGDEPPVPTSREGILVAAARAWRLTDIDQALGALEQACLANDPHKILSLMKEMVPEYSPQANGSAKPVVPSSAADPCNV